MSIAVDKSTALRLLGLAEHKGYVTVEMIKKAFRTKSKEVHPDKGGTQEEFIQMKEAYHFITRKYPDGFLHENVVYDIVDILTVVRVQ